MENSVSLRPSFNVINVLVRNPVKTGAFYVGLATNQKYQSVIYPTSTRLSDTPEVWGHLKIC